MDAHDGCKMAKNEFFSANACICAIFVVSLQPKQNYTDMSKGQYAVASPELTGLTENVTGEVINIRNNPFLGEEIAIRASDGSIYFGASKYFHSI